jgi:hypothetical protein
MTGADELGTAVAGATASAAGDRVVSAVVADVTSTGAVNLLIDGTLVLDVPCADSYRIRQAGDNVAVRISAGQPVVMWRLGADIAGGTLNKAMWGEFAPPAGYSPVDQGVFFQRNTDGTVNLYFRSTTGGYEAGVGPPTDRGQIAHATSSGAWRGTTPSGMSEPAQGVLDDSTPPAKGAWFYGLAILDMFTDLTISEMWLRIVRTYEGPVERLPVNLYLHSHQTLPAGDLVLNEGPYEVGPVSPGGSIRVRIPDDWLTLLSIGPRYGFAVYAESGPFYSFEGPKVGALGTVSGDVEVVYA